MEQQRRNYHNHCIKAKKLVRDVRLSVLQDVYFAAHEKHNIVRNMTLDQVNIKFNFFLVVQSYKAVIIFIGQRVCQSPQEPAFYPRSDPG